MMACPPELLDYLEDCWSLFEAVRKEHPDHVVGHCPIAYFGDLTAYYQSKPRILTVGLNPSHHEFPESETPRFPSSNEALSTSRESGSSLMEEYISDLNSYFFCDRNPYKGWFTPSYASLLEGMGASFYSDPKLHRAVHSDFYSPIATRPVWTDLRAGNPVLYRILKARGELMWRTLVEILAPDVIIASMKRSNDLILRRGFSTRIDWDCPFQRKKARTCAEMHELRLMSGKKCLLVTGGAGRKPMIGYDREEKLLIGKEIIKQWKRIG